MKKLIYFISFFFISFLFINCTGPSGQPGIDGLNAVNNYDKQVSLPFGYSDFSSQPGDTIGDLYTDYKIIKFNITNFINIDSVIFYCELKESDTSSLAEVQIFDLTDSTEILNTVLQTNQSNWQSLVTGNILNYLPGKDIDLCLRIRNAKPTISGISTVRNANLILYRK